MAITVSFVEDNPELRQSLAASLNSAAGLRCGQGYASSEDALREIPLAPPDVVLMDMNLPGANCIQCVGRLKATLPNLRTIILTRFEQIDLVFESICAGAAGYLPKNTPSTELIDAIRQIHAGRFSLTMQIARKAFNYLEPAAACNGQNRELTPRENEILVSLARGNSCAEISAALMIDMNLVHSHIRSVYEKIHLTSEYRKTKPMKKTMNTPRMLLALAACLLTAVFWLLPVAPASAQIGSGWTQETFSERFEYESNDVLITISPPPASFNNGLCEYDNTAGVETFQLLQPASNRAEIRPNDDYSTGSRQFQADVLVSTPSADECIHQIFNGSTAPYLLLREETNNNGSLKVALHTGGGASNLATNLYGTWFRLNSINDLNNGNTYLYVNGALVWQGANPGGTFYTKYGCYGSHTVQGKIQFKNVKLFSGGNEVTQDFSLSATPSSQSVLAGGNTTYTVSATFTNTVNNTVYFSVSGLPAGATANFSPASVVGTGSSTLTVTTSTSTPAGNYPLTITGATSDSSDITHTQTVTLNVSGFTVSGSPGSQTAPSGGTANYTATVSVANGFNGTVTWSASGLPAGATAAFNPTSVTGAGSSTMTVTLANTTPASSYTLNVLGTSSGVTQSNTVTLVVSDFTISATPSSQSVSAGNAANYTVNVGSDNAFSGAVSFTAGGLPSGAIASFNPTSMTAPGSSTLTVTTSGTTPAGSNTLTITGTSGNLSHSASVGLVVSSSSSLPTGWTDADIGSPGLSGSASYNSGVFTLSGSGADIWGTSDQFNYASSSAGTNFSVVTRVASLNAANAWAKSGAMIRQSTAANSSYFAVYVTPGNGASVQCRTATGASAVDLGRATGLTAPYWVKAVRSGSSFKGYYSANGTTWTQLASTNITMANTVTAGLAVCSHDNTALNTSTFDNVTAPAYVFTESEALAFTYSSAGIAGTNTDSNASGGEYIFLNATAASDWIQFTLPSANAGVYDVKMACKTYTARGILSLSIDGTTVGSNFDEYSSSSGYPTHDFGNATLGSGSHTIRLTVTGKNASSSAYTITSDDFTLTPQ
jgi:DNA-binding NarL/FixJ family response regulator